MFYRKRNTTKQIITGALIGSAVGSVLTFLFTPKNGRELRTNIKEGVDKSVGTVKDSSNKFISNAQIMANDFMGKWKSALNAGLDIYKREADRVKTSKEIIEETLVEETQAANTTEPKE